MIRTKYLFIAILALGLVILVWGALSLHMKNAEQTPVYLEGDISQNGAPQEYSLAPENESNSGEARESFIAKIRSVLLNQDFNSSAPPPQPEAESHADTSVSNEAQVESTPTLFMQSATIQPEGEIHTAPEPTPLAQPAGTTTVEYSVETMPE